MIYNNRPNAKTRFIQLENSDSHFLYNIVVDFG